MTRSGRLLLFGAVALFGCKPASQHVVAQLEFQRPVETLTITSDRGDTAKIQSPRAMEWEVEVEATGLKHELSKGSEVWLFNVETPGSRLSKANGAWEGVAWVERESEHAHGGPAFIASVAHQRVRVHLSGNPLRIDFLHHPWSGQAVLTVNGVKTDLDLYDAAGGVKSLVFSTDGHPGAEPEPYEFDVDRGAQTLSVPADGGVTFGAVTVDGTAAPRGAILVHWAHTLVSPWAWLFVVVVGAIALRLIIIALIAPQNLSEARALWASLSLGVVFAFLWGGAFYPGLYSTDSLDQYSQAVTGRFSTWHPPLMAMLMRLAGEPGRFAYVQATLFWSGLFWLLSQLIPNRRLWLLAAAIVSAYPVLWVYSITVWKDVWVGLAGLWAASALVAFLRTRSNRMLVASIAFTALAVCFRHNAITIAVVPPLAYLLTSSRPRIQRFAFAAAMTLAIVAPSRVVSRLPNVERRDFSSADLISPYFFGIVAHINEQDPDRPRLQSELDAVFGPTTFQRVRDNYWCPCNLYLLYGPTALGNNRAMLKHGAEVVDAFKRYAPGHWRELVEHRVCSLKAFMQTDEVRFGYTLSSTENSLNIVDAPYWPRLRKRAGAAVEWAAQTWLMRHDLFDIWLVVLLIGSLVRRNAKFAAVAAFGIAYLAPFLVLDPCSDWRYQFFNFLMALAAGLACLMAGLEAGVRQFAQVRTRR